MSDQADKSNERDLNVGFYLVSVGSRGESVDRFDDVDSVAKKYRKLKSDPDVASVYVFAGEQLFPKMTHTVELTLSDDDNNVVHTGTAVRDSEEDES